MTDRYRAFAPFAVLFLVGAALRVLAILGYRPALWFPDSYPYVVTATHLGRPDLVRPGGYSIFLRLLEPFHSFALIVTVQHLLGLAIGVLVYVVARRFAAPNWIAVLAAAPALLDAYQIELEHLILSDALFGFCVMAAVALALRPVGRRTATAIGLLLATAALTRSVGLPLLVVMAVWLLVRSRSLSIAGIALVAGLVPLAGYAAWFHAAHGDWALSRANGVMLYARTMAFADCAAMKPPPRLAVLCTSTPPSRRPPSQWYIWDPSAPLPSRPGITFSAENNELAGEFAALAIRSQPVDYLATVARDLLRTFGWSRTDFPSREIAGAYEFPSSSTVTPSGDPVGLRSARGYERGPVATQVVEPYAGWLRAYQSFAWLPGAVLGLLLLVCPVLLLLRRRHAEWSALLPWTFALLLLTIPCAVVEFDYRYVLPATPLACLAAALTCRVSPRKEHGSG